MTRDTLSRVTSCIAAITRYPAKLLTSDADLENDLGIDSVKRFEIVVGLGEEFGVDLQSEERDPSIRTIEDVASWVDRMLQRSDSQSAGSEQHEADGGTTINGAHTVSHRISPAQPAPPPHFETDRAHFETNRAEPPEPAAPSCQPTKTLAGRVAMVTGSGHGIGRIIARLLAARGATLVINSFHSRDEGERTAAEIKAQGGHAIHLWGSIANPEHVDRLFEQIEQQFGYLDILVCNASDGRIGPFLELSVDDWTRAFRTNVSGHHQCAVRAARLMHPRGGGSIVTLSAVGAQRFIDGLGCQGVVKAAVETLTRYLACELGRFGIRVNCVAGGPVYGDVLDKFPEAEATKNHWESIVPDGELCSPMDLAQTIAFLVSEEARGINGAVWMVDHGFSAVADGRPLRTRSRQQIQVST